MRWSTLIGDAPLLYAFSLFFACIWVIAECREKGWYAKRKKASLPASMILTPGAYASTKRGSISWDALDFAFGIISVNTLQIINSADETVTFKVFISAFVLVGMIRLFFFNGWSRNQIIGFVGRARNMSEGTKSMPAQVRAAHERDDPPSTQPNT